MKILALSYLYPNSLYPNYGIFVHNRLRAVSKHNQIKVINPIPWFPGCGKLLRYKNYDQIPEHEFIDDMEVFHPRFFVIPKFLKSIDAITYKMAVMPIVEKLYNKFKFDLIDLHWTYPDLPTGYAIKKEYNKKMLVTLRGKEAFHINEGIGREKLIKHYLRQTDAVIGLSQALVDMAISFGVDKEKCRVIRNGVDTSAFYHKDQEECRKKLNIPLEEKVILTVGSLNFRKGFDRIIKALPAILAIEPACKLYIIGSAGPDGDYQKEIYNLIDTLNLQNTIIFKGTISNGELIRWYNAVDLFCLSSRGEGSPNVLTEALACGCPSVATDVGAVRDILNKEQYGVIAQNTNNGICIGLQNALSTTWDREHISYEQQGLDWEWCAKKVNSTYKWLSCNK